jgi:hypothetical protein
MRNRHAGFCLSLVRAKEESEGGTVTRRRHLISSLSSSTTHPQTPSMLPSLRLALRPSTFTVTAPRASPVVRRYLSTTPPRSMDAYKRAGNKAPEHQMVHFKGLLSEKRSFGDFRTVLHTGLFSQVVAMEVPVGGDIGDEVSLFGFVS